MSPTLVTLTLIVTKIKLFIRTNLAIFPSSGHKNKSKRARASEWEKTRSLRKRILCALTVLHALGQLPQLFQFFFFIFVARSFSFFFLPLLLQLPLPSADAEMVELATALAEVHLGLVTCFAFPALIWMPDILSNSFRISAGQLPLPLFLSVSLSPSQYLTKRSACAAARQKKKLPAFRACLFFLIFFSSLFFCILCSCVYFFSHWPDEQLLGIRWGWI